MKKSRDNFPSLSIIKFSKRWSTLFICILHISDFVLYFGGQEMTTAWKDHFL